MKNKDPHADSQDELRRCIAELMNAQHSLADDNAGVSRCDDERLRRVRAMLNRPLTRRAQQIVYAVGRALAHELMTEIAKRILETLVRLSPMPYGRALLYDDRINYQNPTHVRWASAAGARDARRDFCVFPFAA